MNSERKLYNQTESLFGTGTNDPLTFSFLKNLKSHNGLVLPVILCLYELVAKRVAGLARPTCPAPKFAISET
jgi:hypothetical protein